MPRSSSADGCIGVIGLVLLVWLISTFGFSTVVILAVVLFGAWGVYMVWKTVENRGRFRHDSPKANALTCRKCNSLAYPISNTGNRYRCESYGNQSANRHHGY